MTQTDDPPAMRWAIHEPVYRTELGTPYLKAPGVVLLSSPLLAPPDILGFLHNLDESFMDYMTDYGSNIPDSDQLVKMAGQLCYLSFSKARTKNEDTDRYMTNIKEQGHGSVLEHANFSFLFYGVSRSLTHELVRHRAGFAFSQVSQRYVGIKHLRFVEGPEYETHPGLHAQFLAWIDSAFEEYQDRMDILKSLVGYNDRKLVQQAARRCLPNETEAPIIVTANARAWRHFLEMRGSEHAEVEIRLLACRVLTILQKISRFLFDDYEIRLNENTGVVYIRSEYKKV